MFRTKITRRKAMASMAAACTAGALTGLGRSSIGRAANEDGPRFLIVLCATGGASLLDGPLAIRASEAGTNAPYINCFPDFAVPQLDPEIAFSAVDGSANAVGPIPIPVTTSQSTFVQKHYREMMVATLTSTSVNHAVAQKRAVTGNDAFMGRTLQESVAAAYGEGFPIPNVHLSSGTGFCARGSDETLPAWAFAEQVADPKLWPLSLDGQRGTPHPVSREALQRARAIRNDELDARSKFTAAFGAAPRLRRWQELRGAPQAAIEAASLIDQLVFVPESADYPWTDHDLRSNDAAAPARAAFPNWAWDPLHAQAVLAFLLLKYRVSVTVTLGPNFDLVLRDGVELGGGQLPEGSMGNPPIAFDFSHQAHRATQGFMWKRMYEVADGLIDLLRAEEWADGQSLWDRTMIYLATDFGRTKARPENAPEFESGHDLNNGILCISPLVNGNRVLGGRDPTTGLTYGFDPVTGAPDPNREMTEKEIHAGLLGAMGIDTGGMLPSVPAMQA